jgi:hypothetical protein
VRSVILPHAVRGASKDLCQHLLHIQRACTLSPYAAWCHLAAVILHMAAKSAHVIQVVLQYMHYGTHRAAPVSFQYSRTPTHPPTMGHRSCQPPGAGLVAGSKDSNCWMKQYTACLCAPCAGAGTTSQPCSHWLRGRSRLLRPDCLRDAGHPTGAPALTGGCPAAADRAGPGGSRTGLQQHRAATCTPSAAGAAAAAITAELAGRST